VKRRLLQQSPNVVLVSIDEFRTSKTCSKCMGCLSNMKAKSIRHRRDAVTGERSEMYETYGRIHKVLHCRNSVLHSMPRGRDVEP
jgi:hypothetical protein